MVYSRMILLSYARVTRNSCFHSDVVVRSISGPLFVSQVVMFFGKLFRVWTMIEALLRPSEVNISRKKSLIYGRTVCPACALP